MATYVAAATPSDSVDESLAIPSSAAALSSNGLDSSSLSSSSPSSVSDTAVTTSSASFSLLQSQHVALQSSYDLLASQHSTSLTSLSEALARVTELESSLASSQHSLTSTQAEYESLQRAHEEIVANRNYFKRKCESLASSVDKMLKQEAEATAAASTSSSSSSASDSRLPPRGLTPSSSMSKLTTVSSVAVTSDREVQQLRLTVSQLRTECSELQQTLQAYKRTLENNHALLKAEREANLMLSSKAGSGTNGGGGGLFSRSSKVALLAQQAQFDSVRSLANSLSELVSDKDLSIAHLKKSNLILSARVHSLETRFESELEKSGEKTYYGHIHLDGLEQEEAKAREESANKNRRNSEAGIMKKRQQRQQAINKRHE